MTVWYTLWNSLFIARQDDGVVYLVNSLFIDYRYSKCRVPVAWSKYQRVCIDIVGDNTCRSVTAWVGALL